MLSSLSVNIDPALLKWSKWVSILLIARARNPIFWSSFLSLNPFIRKHLLLIFSSLQTKSNKAQSLLNSQTVERRIAKLSNLLSSFFLYLASADNDKIPKDYALIYIWINYYGHLNTPSDLNILVSPNLSSSLKIDYYKSKWVSSLYSNKEFVIFPLLFAQILSNYLTPTEYKLNQRYLSSSIKSWLLDPIWKNYSLGINYQKLNCLGLTKSYITLNFYIIGIMMLTNFKERFIDRFNEIKRTHSSLNIDTIIGLAKEFLYHVFNKSNSIANLIYCPNLISIFLISLTSPVLSYLRTSSVSRANSFATDHQKLFFKLYTKIVGIIAGFSTIYFNSIDSKPEFSCDNINDTSIKKPHSENIRYISKSFINALNLYLFRLILLSKWRITKENHPWLKVLKLKTWKRIESLIMCLGVWKVMNLNDYLKKKRRQQKLEVFERLENDFLMKTIDRVM